MKRFFILPLVLLLALSLSACKKEDAEPVPDAPVSAAPEETKTPAEDFTTVTGDAFAPTNLKSVSATAIVTEGRVPEGEYDLPAEESAVEDWVIQGGVALLKELSDADAAFYIVEEKEFSPALIRWGDSIAEFDFPCAAKPGMWYADLDGDGAEELALTCYAGGGTGVSVEELHVLEKNEDGTLTAYSYPRETLAAALDNGIQIAFSGDRTYVSLGQGLVDITGELNGEKLKYENNGVNIGPSLYFKRTEDGFACHQRILIEAEDVVGPWYVAWHYSDVYYRDGKFLLDFLSIRPNQ